MDGNWIMNESLWYTLSLLHSCSVDCFNFANMLPTVVSRLLRKSTVVNSGQPLLFHGIRSELSTDSVRQKRSCFVKGLLIKIIGWLSGTWSIFKDGRQKLSLLLLWHSNVGERSLWSHLDPEFLKEILNDRVFRGWIYIVQQPPWC